ncbi:hypothetical protein JW905_08570, partial [bacterium]|nr:hypothetical protein [candidate division CSSED10-310 bacterium]
VPAHHDFFGQFGMIADRHWYSQYPPGFPALLAPFVLLGAPWLLNPLLGALTVILIRRFAARLYDEATGNFAALLAAVSPFAVFLAGSHMSHTATHFFVLAAFSFMMRDKPAPGNAHACAAGAALGAAALCRPVTALAVAIPLAAAWLANLWKQPRRTIPPAACFLLAGFAAAALLLSYNSLTTGEPLLFGYEKLFGKEHTLGFGKNPWGPPHTPDTGWLHTIQRLAELRANLFYCLFPSLLLPLLPFLMGKATRREYILGAVPLSLLGIQFCYYYKEFFFPPRFLLESLFALVTLAAVGMHHLAGWAAASRRHAFIAVFLLLSMLPAAVMHLPVDIHRFSTSYGDVEDQLSATVTGLRIEEALIFMSNNASDNDYYSSGFMLNDLDPNSGSLVFARDLGARNQELRAAHANKQAFLYTYHSQWDVGTIEQLAASHP